MRLARSALCLAAAALVAAAPLSTAQAEPKESPVLAEAVAEGRLPPLEKRLPEVPSVEPLDQDWQEPGRYGGRLRTLMAKARDLRQLYVYGYARLVAYDAQLELRPDILEKVDNEADRVFTLHLRPGHRWSDGQPFTSEDFRYWWEDVAKNDALSPAGPPIALQVDGEAPTVEILDETTVRYSWSRPHPTFMHLLAKARPPEMYMPAHYLKQFHERYADPGSLASKVEAARQRNWAALHNRMDSDYKGNNVEIPTLQPWMNTTAPPSERFVYVRNPYFHRVDPQGRQLPYIDEIVVQIAGGGIIPAKTGTGESDLQARYIRFDNYTFLKEAEKRTPIDVSLWQTAEGARLTLYPNLNVVDPVYQSLFRDVRFRRALSLAINRHEINQVVFYGLGLEGNNTVLPESPLFKPEYRTQWATFDLDEANRLLDEIGLTERDDRGIRFMPDGRPLQIIVETTGESTEESDVLELITDSWAQAGIALYSKPSQREVFRNRVFSGQAQMGIGKGLENGLANAAMTPIALAPASQNNLQWPRWGQYVETRGQAGEPPAMAVAKELMALYKRWRDTPEREARREIWHRMLALHAEHVLTIGLIAGIPQPIVASRRLRNIPEKGLYNWDPGAFFGIYRPDSFWLAPAASD